MSDKDQQVSCQINIQPNESAKKPAEISKDGSFKRQVNRFTTPFGEKADEWPVEANRYRLIWSAACPWAHRSVIVRKVLGLDQVISLGAVSPMRPQIGRVDWAFSLDAEEKDPVLGIQYVSDIYKKTDPNYDGRPTVPVMVDVEKQQAVNNDYFTLTNSFETVWAPFHKKNAPDLYPEHLRKEIDALSETIFHDVNNGVYKCGFAASQEAYEEAYDQLFARLDELEERLSTKRFLFGDYITDTDVRFYTTLVRFDIAYYNAFNTNKKLIREYPNLWGYARDLYQTPGFGETTDFDAIKRHYHLSITINPDKSDTPILPKGPELSVWESSHDRERLSKTNEKYLLRAE
ncbi:glutathione S-transferase C-terminal domain-containing protein [Aquibacillus koreensis]|uniref:Glutathione S-transferase C-terminal domain-containing protein n=1 Tax=Aquibacillus koreensis TaxID=279446 RepID=A0A9X3WLT3_9BACI|nr:glutathione S-transferase C-terminal domain-containing protein [Aquibacillus koreensis]MCT2537690.1 glutathione S-transferase C-terminal domain-containing protein [Aquibacillus koreensis]MDC3420963.1 glutathione S-transferase C-terminal domain-containing protein [Aquibacillus koreensis]